jgi:hypothetical protein
MNKDIDVFEEFMKTEDVEMLGTISSSNGTINDNVTAFTVGGTGTFGSYYPYTPYHPWDECDCHLRCPNCGKKKSPLRFWC